MTPSSAPAGVLRRSTSRALPAFVRPSLITQCLANLGVQASVFGTAHRAVLESAIVTKVKSWAAGRASRDSARAREVAAQDVAQRSLVLNQERAQRARRALSGEEGIEIE